MHHGNGTVDAFEGRDEGMALYISLHLWAHGDFYPGTGNPRNVGDNGSVVNIGWNDAGKGDAEYCAAFQTIVLPVLASFNPELILISAGFDAAAGQTTLAVPCSILQYLAVFGSALQYLAVPGSIWQYLAVSCSTWQYLAVPCSIAAVPGSIWQCLAVSQQVNVFTGISDCNVSDRRPTWSYERVASRVQSNDPSTAPSYTEGSGCARGRLQSDIDCAKFGSCAGGVRAPAGVCHI